MNESKSVREYCLELLESGSLGAKLRPPRRSDGTFVTDADPGEPLILDAPARTGEIAFARNGRAVITATHPKSAGEKNRCTPGASDPSPRATGAHGRIPKNVRDRNHRSPLPHLHELSDPRASAACLARFAHHELMAVELFAWALLAYPRLPSPLRHGFLRVLEEEQLHLRLYLERLAELGSSLEEHPVGNYFWRQVPAIRQSPEGVLAFLSAMGLTFEQANLDHAQLYRDAYIRIGDTRTAAIVDRVHHDEIGHVRLAVIWLRRLGAARIAQVDTPMTARPLMQGRVPSEDQHVFDQDSLCTERASSIDPDVALYEATVPFPLSAARAKGRHFDPEPRRRAGMSAAYIEYIRQARPYRES